MFGKKSKPIPSSKEYLYAMLAEKDAVQSDFWKGLVAVDRELTAGCIYMETIDSAAPAKPIGEFTRENAFHSDANTLVIRLKKIETATHAANLLNDFFKCTGTKFIAELEEKDGVTTPLLRSNIDKRHWEKLCVFCDYRFHNEIENPDERARLMRLAQKRVSRYTSNTPDAHWKATEGVPAAIILCGLHGLLRPVRNKNDKPKPSKREYLESKYHELNDPHPHGTPRAFDGVILNGVNMTQEGDVIISVDLHRLALERATGGTPLTHLAIEAIFGANPIEKGVPVKKAIAMVGFGSATISTIMADGLMDLLPLFLSVSTAATLLGVHYGNNWFKELKHIAGIKSHFAHHAKTKELVFGSTQKTHFVGHDEPDSQITEAYTKNADIDFAAGAEAVDISGNKIARAIVSAGPTSDYRLHARLTSGMGGLGMR